MKFVLRCRSSSHGGSIILETKERGKERKGGREGREGGEADKYPGR